jgi:RND family efflux transporter MFP subunit
MPLARKLFLSLLLLVVAFLAGYWLRRPESAAKGTTRQPLYYYDPMHPAYKSDKPGIAPDCGMQLEPVYADDPLSSGSTLPPGGVRISTEKQQIMGLRTAKVTRAAGSHTVHVLGRVAADETRIDRVTALAEGVVRSVSPYAVGNVVHKDDVLGKYFVSTREMYSAMQNYFVAVSALEQGIQLNSDPAALDSRQAQIRLAEELLQTYGLTEAQIRELARTRQITRDIEFRAPVTGIVLARNMYRGQRVERGAELFQIADLSHAWVLAELFENESGLLRPGSTARVRYRERTYRASVADAQQFDPASRTLKVRLELENPDLLLRPEMFVDVEFDVREPEGISVPLDAVLDLGPRKAVFVSTGEGVFEPREVTTGTRFGDRVQIVKGLEEGDSVVVSGLFLLDSESRLRLASANAAKAAPKPADAGAAATSDPVCGMDVDPADAAGKSMYKGKTYYFCSKDCKSKFDQDPARYVGEGHPGMTKEGQP